jgi:hypothetical protein
LCELNGQHVNPDNGSTTEGKTGLMRCRDGEGGPVLREQELQQGKFMGVVRYYKDGALEREYRVNEKGNRDGLAREWARAEPGAKPVLVTRGDAARQPHRRHRAELVSERPAAPRLLPRRRGARAGERRVHERRQARRPALRGEARARRRLRRQGGVRLRRRRLERHALQRQGRREGAPLVRARRAQEERDALGQRRGARVERADRGGGVERAFAADGTKRREVQWTTIAGERPRRVTTPRPGIPRERQAGARAPLAPSERGAELQLEATWYLNGQPKTKSEYSVADGRTLRRETSFHDNGRKAFEGSWQSARRPRRGATGTQQTFDAKGGCAASGSTTSAAASSASASSTSAATSSATTRCSRTDRERRWDDERTQRGKREFDYVIVGGGSAGCVLAARLSEDPAVAVCLLEAGPVDKSVLIHCPRASRCWRRTARSTGRSRRCRSRA